MWKRHRIISFCSVDDFNRSSLRFSRWNLPLKLINGYRINDPPTTSATIFRFQYNTQTIRTWSQPLHIPTSASRFLKYNCSYHRNHINISSRAANNIMIDWCLIVDPIWLVCHTYISHWSTDPLTEPPVHNILDLPTKKFFFFYKKITQKEWYFFVAVIMV